MKIILLLSIVLPLCFSVSAQDCNLIENRDTGLINVSYQTVFVTIPAPKAKLNIKFWKFRNKFTISTFVVTNGTFCVDTTSTVSFNFDDGSRFTFVSGKRKNCRGELDKDFLTGEMPTEISGLATRKVISIDVKALAAKKTFTTDVSNASNIQASFRCIIEKK